MDIERGRAAVVSFLTWLEDAETGDEGDNLYVYGWLDGEREPEMSAEVRAAVRSFVESRDDVFALVDELDSKRQKYGLRYVVAGHFGLAGASADKFSKEIADPAVFLRFLDDKYPGLNERIDGEWIASTTRQLGENFQDPRYRASVAESASSMTNAIARGQASMAKSMSIAANMAAAIGSAQRSTSQKGAKMKSEEVGLTLIVTDQSGAEHVLKEPAQKVSGFREGISGRLGMADVQVPFSRIVSATFAKRDTDESYDTECTLQLKDGNTQSIMVFGSWAVEGQTSFGNVVIRYANIRELNVEYK